MHKKIKTGVKIVGLFMECSLLCSLLLYGCKSDVPAGTENVETGPVEATETAKEAGDDTETDAEALAKELEALTRGEIHLNTEELSEYAIDCSLRYEKEPEQMKYSLSMPQIPESDDAYLYLFAFKCYENQEELTGEPVAYGRKGRECEVSFSYEKEYLFEQFVPTLLVDGEYVPIGRGIYLSNPEALAKNTEAYPVIDSKKGLLLDPTMFGTKELTDLNVKYAIYNIPLSIIMAGEEHDEDSTIEYVYCGTSYYFDKNAIKGYDDLFIYLTKIGMCSTAIVLNDWNENHLEMIHPEALNQESGAFYYMLNTAEEEGEREWEAVAAFLTERYSGGEYGMVHNWVIANEINQFRMWNYMDTDDLTHYTEEFEKAFRIFYQAAKSSYSEAKVYFSIDHDWNSNQGNSKEYFNSRELITAFNEAVVSHGNYDWGIAIHPYPDPLSRVNYWSLDYDKTQDAKILSIMNLNVLTDFLKQEEYLDTEGNVRNITITELGFSSQSGEKLQAAAVAYCYYIVDDNPYIEAFIMNRQTDAPEEVMQGLSFGLYEYDHSEKFVKEVYQYIDTDRNVEYIDFMLNILKADSLEEALDWAR